MAAPTAAMARRVLHRIRKPVACPAPAAWRAAVARRLSSMTDDAKGQGGSQKADVVGERKLDAAGRESGAKPQAPCRNFTGRDRRLDIVDVDDDFFRKQVERARLGHEIRRYANLPCDLYIVYLGDVSDNPLGDVQSDNPQEVTASQISLLKQVLGSEEKAAQSMVYSFNSLFSGFVVWLTKTQARTLASLPG
ncbi:hypothetical protein ACP70R_027084 [Stipagrostis hirtigluma subsp. patula]